MRGRQELTTSRSGSRSISRRALFRAAGGTTAGVVAAQVTGLLPGQAVLAAAKNTRTVYRLSPLGQPACNACRAHDANRYFRTSTAAIQNRAHLGCNCAVVSHPLPVNLWNEYFKHAGVDRTVYDLRWGKKAK